MKILVLGGTGWLAAWLASGAVRCGHEVVCLARGLSGTPPTGASFVRADRSDVGAYQGVMGVEWDAVFDVSRHPGHVRGATTQLAEQAEMYVYVSSVSAYADDPGGGRDEDAALLQPLQGDVLTSLDLYGQAKVACEHHVKHAFGSDRSLIARPCLIAGPGDVSDRTGYWPFRFAHPSMADGRVLVPDTPSEVAQVIDVRDLADWLLAAAEARVSGAYDTTGPTVSLAEHLEVARAVAGHRGPLVPAPGEWLEAHGVQPWAGPRSLPLWTGEPTGSGSEAHSGAKARSAGLANRPLDQTLADSLAWEESRTGLVVRAAGLTDHDERQLLGELTQP